MADNYDRVLFIGVRPPSSRKVKGIDIITQSDVQTKTLGEKIGGDFSLTLNRGLIGLLESLYWGGGIGNVEKRAYNVISSVARKRGASIAVVTGAFVESTEILPSYSLDFGLHK